MSSLVRKEKEFRYAITVNSKWKGKWYPVPFGLTTTPQQFFSAKEYSSRKKALNVAKNQKGNVEVYRIWGLGPEQRKVIKRYPEKKRVKSLKSRRRGT